MGSAPSVPGQPNQSMLSGFGGGTPFQNTNWTGQGNPLAGLQPLINQWQQGQNNPLMPLPPSGGTPSPFPNTNVTGQGSPLAGQGSFPNTNFTGQGNPGGGATLPSPVLSSPFNYNLTGQMNPNPPQLAPAPPPGLQGGGSTTFQPSGGTDWASAHGIQAYPMGPGPGGGATLPGALPQQLGQLLAQGG